MRVTEPLKTCLVYGHRRIVLPDEGSRDEAGRPTVLFARCARCGDVKRKEINGERAT